jgi:hypothetical protein
MGAGKESCPFYSPLLSLDEVEECRAGSAVWPRDHNPARRPITPQEFMHSGKRKMLSQYEIGAEVSFKIETEELVELGFKTRKKDFILPRKWSPA